MSVANEKRRLQMTPTGYYDGFGGSLFKTRAGRRGARPLTCKGVVHLVLKTASSRDLGVSKNRRFIESAAEKYASDHGLKVLSLANSHNHLHLIIKLTRKASWRPFIRAFTAAVAMFVAGKNRWSGHKKEKFWGARPFTRIAESVKAIARLKDYVRLNQLEARCSARAEARFLVALENAQAKGLPHRHGLGWGIFYD